MTYLTQEQADTLPIGAEIEVVWSGGNGPHRYTITGHSDTGRAVIDTGDMLEFVGLEAPRTRVQIVAGRPMNEGIRQLWGDSVAYRFQEVGRIAAEAGERLSRLLETAPHTPVLDGAGRLLGVSVGPLYLRDPWTEPPTQSYRQRRPVRPGQRKRGGR